MSLVCVQLATYSLHLYNVRTHAEIFSICLQFLQHLTHIKNHISSLPLCNKPNMSWFMTTIPNLFSGSLEVKSVSRMANSTDVLADFPSPSRKHSIIKNTPTSLFCIFSCSNNETTWSINNLRIHQFFTTYLCPKQWCCHLSHLRPHHQIV